jgi:hypothetical protein
MALQDKVRAVDLDERIGGWGFHGHTSDQRERENEFFPHG